MLLFSHFWHDGDAIGYEDKQLQYTFILLSSPLNIILNIIWLQQDQTSLYAIVQTEKRLWIAFLAVCVSVCQHQQLTKYEDEYE